MERTKHKYIWVKIELQIFALSFSVYKDYPSKKEIFLNSSVGRYLIKKSDKKLNKKSR